MLDVPDRPPSVDFSLYSDHCGLTSPTVSHLHRSVVGSISAAEAVKSLQQPVLVKEESGQSLPSSTCQPCLFLTNK